MRKWRGWLVRCINNLNSYLHTPGRIGRWERWPERPTLATLLPLERTSNRLDDLDRLLIARGNICQSTNLMITMGNCSHQQQQLLTVVKREPFWMNEWELKFGGTSSLLWTFLVLKCSLFPWLVERYSTDWVKNGPGGGQPKIFQTLDTFLFFFFIAQDGNRQLNGKPLPKFCDWE